jgi:hypothetical protein
MSNLRRMAREQAGAHRSCPVAIVYGSDRAPEIEGHSYYHTTPSGRTIVYNPNAYGWRTLYHPSTLRVVVGDRWPTRAQLAAAAAASEQH